MCAKQFETFLVSQFLLHAKGNIRAGYRYQFNSPDHRNSQRLFDALIVRKDGDIQARNGVMLSYLSLEDCKVVPVLHSEEEGDTGFTENYISHLRDEIASQEGPLKGCALVVIHNSRLDTLINSAEDLGQPGQVWSPEKIKVALSGLIEQTDKSRDVSLCLLDDQFDAILEDGATMFGFESLYKAVEDGELCFRELGMFDDPFVAELSGNKKQIKQRLQENRSLYQELSFEVENFGQQLEEKLKGFSSKFIKEHFSDDGWKDVEFETYREEIKKNKTQHLKHESEKELNNAEVIGRYPKETKAGLRDRHLIIELDEDQSEFELQLSFSGTDDLSKEQFKLTPANAFGKQDVLTTRLTSKGANATLAARYGNKPLFFNLALKRENSSENHNFRCLVVRKGEFFLDEIKNIFVIEPTKQRLTLKTADNRLVINPVLATVRSLDDVGEEVDRAETGVVDFESLANESEDIGFVVKSGDNALAFRVEGEQVESSLSFPLLLNQSRFHKLFDDDVYGVLYPNKDVVAIDNSEFRVMEPRISLLRWEERFVQQKMLYLAESNSLALEQLRAIDDTLHNAYHALFDYLASRRTTISLVSWGPQFTSLVMAAVEAFLAYFEAIPTGGMLSKEQKLVMQIGLVRENGDEYYSSFHPLVLAYYLNLCNEMQKDDSFADLPTVTFNRLGPSGLLPYVYHAKHDFAYNQQVTENSFWIKSVPHQKSCLKFVRKLVKEKINEFQKAFVHLFTGSEKSILINAVNQDRAEELFFGLVDYVKDNLESSAAIHVNLYDDELAFNAFDQFAESSTGVKLISWLELDRGNVREHADTIIDILRTRLTYSKFTNAHSEREGQAYSHLSFFRNNDNVKLKALSVDDMPSGIACDGLLTGDASKSDQGSYFTAFGLQNVQYRNQPHLEMAKYVGSLMEPAFKPSTPYTGSNAPALAVSEDFKSLLERSYDSSIWTTIIDPKVTLDFFHANQDVVLIHYSDQYTSSASYDAITVTAQRDLFERVVAQSGGGQINEFNAFNGDWLLKMMTCNDTIRKERTGIIGAYKFATCLVHQSDITWVPLSVGEMIRVSGNIGLKMTDSDFSRNVQGYKKGAISDDVLLVGFKEGNMYLLPVEVKTGSTPDYKKAVQQANELRRYLTELLSDETLASKLYRGLFIRQVLMQIDKYRLYNVFSNDYFEALLGEKEEWLRGNYSIAELENYPAGIVISHLESGTCFEPSYSVQEEVLKVDLPMSLLPSLVQTPLQVLMNEKDIAKICHVPAEYMLVGETQASDPERVSAVDKQDEEPAKPEVDPAPEPEIKVDPMPLVSASSDNLHVLFGHNATTNAPLNWEPTNTAKFMNTNTGIIGTMGTGKTQFTKSVITQLYRNQAENVNSAPIGMLIFDYKSDYVDDKFIDATHAKKYKLFRLPYNPLSLYGDTPMLPIHTAAGFSETMSRAYGLGKKQQLRLENLILESYAAAGIHPEDPTTWSRPAPTIDDVWALFLEQEKVEEDSLYAALSKLARFKIFESEPEKMTSLYELVDGITVVELAGYPSEIQNLVVALTLDLFYSQMQKKGKPDVVGDFRQITKMILVDEADNFMSQNFPSLRKILKEGREYGVGVILSTQDITHFQTGENDYSSYVLTWVIHRVAKIRPQELKAIFCVNEKAEQEKLMETINKLEKHYSLYIDGAKKIVKMRDRAFWELPVYE
ncbi:TPA: DNA phosphorothioation-dependent restriction protein DptH [Vibrio vulnificus]|uniref:DNA phosphorothioation-dependent restriction protein DptH n=2 Tax=Vibrio vulnificus TaxID=672 RepID=UPI00030D6311|nr:DNA phosphorothioation-dependent restriction protein DptH [Vibrio vulnificus]ASM97269.1 DNA phosphorothioation-dependent restriction protein DptH [Vibrio vulnificus NBRC 15645 = ATCC 27562]EHD2236937.1 DNA phosphorothioation-dependent restriction protein DptH [Vibrio vulnificus]EHT4874241.1 DNA phosphorothioation-dependent restriction protein DptH [Vibrio vulnificus]EHZ2493631.1 DNA phosphorothioation-dependent restriction protein DptH [Vibrio vulnificus]EIA0803894.1 DNA phosphorothioation-